MDKCIFCGSTQLIRNISVGSAASSKKRFGPKYKAKLGHAIEPVLADICPHCNRIARLFVHSTERQFV